MYKLTFLKLEGLHGPSYAPRHIGDFEVSPYYTFSHQPILRAGPNGVDFSQVLPSSLL